MDIDATDMDGVKLYVNAFDGVQDKGEVGIVIWTRAKDGMIDFSLMHSMSVETAIQLRDMLDRQIKAAS